MSCPFSLREIFLPSLSSRSLFEAACSSKPTTLRPCRNSCTLAETSVQFLIHTMLHSLHKQNEQREQNTISLLPSEWSVRVKSGQLQNVSHSSELQKSL